MKVAGTHHILLRGRSLVSEQTNSMIFYILYFIVEFIPPQIDLPHGLDRDWELDASSRAAYSRTANECTRADRPRVDSISALTLRRRPVDAAARIRSRFPLDEGLGLSAFIKVIRLPSIRSSFHLKDGWLHYPSPLFESMTANGIPNFGPRVFCHFPCKHREQRHFFQGFLTGRLPYERLLLMLLDNGTALRAFCT